MSFRAQRGICFCISEEADSSAFSLGTTPHSETASQSSLAGGTHRPLLCEREIYAVRFSRRVVNCRPERSESGPKTIAGFCESPSTGSGANSPYRPKPGCRERVSSDPARGHAHPGQGEPHDHPRTIIPTLFTGDPQVTHRISTRLCVGEIGILWQPHHPFAGLITQGERKNEEERVRDIQVRSEQDIKANLFSCHHS